MEIKTHYNGLLDIIKSMHPRRRWARENGYRDVLKICLPLVASNISVAAMLFTDRLFLSNYSLDAISASLPAGVTFVTVSAFFQGLVAYVSVFTAQYTGAGKHHRAAAAMWQGLYISLAAGILIGLSWFLAPAIFKLSNHPENVQRLEVIYYRVLAVASVFDLLYFTMSSFMAGMGRTRIIMYVNLIGMLINIPLNYIFIFGLQINGVALIPAWGTFGAALATVISWVCTTVIFAVLIFNKRMEKSHKIFSSRAFDLKLMKRMAVFGSPGGLQRFLELAAFTFFAFAVGRLGEVYLAANNIIFSIESLSFFPMMGLGATISILVGQAVGSNKASGSREAVISGIGVSSVYLVVIAATFLFGARSIMHLFLPDVYDAATVAHITDLGVVLLRFVVLYCMFDGIYLCCFGAVSGAGDVWFPMGIMAVVGTFCLALPIVLLFTFGQATIYNLWIVFVFYVLCQFVAIIWRYKSGRWLKMRVIEYTPL